MRDRKSNIGDDESPDAAECEHCGQPISWDEICYTHDSSGFANCGVNVSGGRAIASGILVDPEVLQVAGWEGKCAEPTEWFEGDPR